MSNHANSPDGDKTKTRNEKKEEQPALDGGWGWMTVIGCFIVHMVIGGGVQASVGLIYLELIDRYRSSAAATSWVFSLYNLIRFGLAPVVGVLSDRFGCRPLVMVGGLLVGIGYTVSAFAPQLWILYATFSVAGIGGALCFAPGYIIIGRYFDKRKGKAMAIATSGVSLGGVGSPYLIRLWFSTYGYFGCMLLLGAIMFHACVSGALYRPLQHILNRKRTVRYESSSKHNYNAVQLESIDVSKEDKPNVDVIVTRRLRSFSDPHRAEIILNSSDFQYSSFTSLNNLHVQDQEASVGKGEKANGNVQLDTQTCSIAHLKQKDVNIVEHHLNHGINANGNSTFKDEKPHESKHRCNILRNIDLNVHALNSMAMTFVFGVYATFLPALCVSNGIQLENVLMSLSITNMTGLVFNILLGVIFDLKALRPHKLIVYSTACFSAGAIFLLFPFCTNFAMLLSLSVTFFVPLRLIHSQRATMLSEFVGSHQLAGATGYILFQQGIGHFTGPVIGGMLRDTLNNYSYIFYLAGGVMMITSLLYSLVFIRKFRTKKF